ncbi:ABC transporter permease [Bacillus sp. NTK074B]|uniref:ABC transporter permease n=1 Tax=Bacillus sp. NTK074B TaxID=2802174 RepID=UPI001A8EE4EA|nr:ABC transporter permease [Bacillus sp. NTK074B]
MRFKDKLQFIRQNMKKSKSRVFMTILATAIGCAFLIVLTSVGFGAQKYIEDSILSNRSVTEINVHGKEQVDEGGNPEITTEDIQNLEGIDNVKSVTRKQLLRFDPLFEFGKYFIHAPVFLADYPSEVKAGLTLSEGRMPENEHEIIVGYHIQDVIYKAPKDQEPIPSEELFNGEGVVKEELRYTGEKSLLGEEIKLKVFQYKDGEQKTKDIPLTIVGITEAPSRDWMKDTQILLSTDVLPIVEQFTETPFGQTITPDMSQEDINDMTQQTSETTYQEVNVIANSMENVEGISTALKEKGYYIYSVSEELDQLNVVFAVIKSGLIFIGTIALLIASIGIYNTMSMAVTERTQDIGIMKAIGGQPRMIRNIFLLESGYIGLIGAFVGVVVAYGISMAVNFALPFVIQQVFNQEVEEAIQLSYIPTYVSILCVLLSVGVAMISGLKPAIKATRIDVLKALRRDM